MKLLIYGSGGLGRVIYDSVVRYDHGRWDEVFFVNDFIPEQEFYGTRTIHFESISSRFELDKIEVLIAVGEPSDREKLFEKVKNQGLRLATYIDELALVSPTAVLEEGAIVCAHAVVDSYAKIGKNTVIEYFGVIGHDVIIGENSVISLHTGIGGFTEVGDNVFIGMQATLKDRIKVGNGAVVTMGSVVYKDVENNMFVMGNPARVTLGNNEHKVFR